jgi:hypothetical protein
MYNNFKKGLILGIIFLLMLVSLPIVSSQRILYPKEEGPYTVIIMGPSNGMSGGFFPFFHVLPLWLLFYPLDIGWDFDPDSVFFVNGEKQDIVYPAQIELSGFKGYGHTIYMLMVKGFATAYLGSVIGFMPSPRARVIGLCTEILVYDSR